MNKLYICLILLLMVNTVYAVSIDRECTDNGFDFGIVKFEWNGNSYQPEDSTVSPYELIVTGDASEVNWGTNYQIGGVLIKASTHTEVYAGGTSGTVYGWETTNPQGKPVTHDISYITFCGKSNDGCTDCNPPNGVPEFSTTTLALAVVGGCLGLTFLRKN